MRTIEKIFNTTVSVKEGASRNVLRGIVQYDTLNKVNVRLSDGSKAFDYTDYTNIIFKALKADGTTYVDSEGNRVIATSPTDGIVTVILADQATTAAGLCQSVIEVWRGVDKLTTARLNYEVFESLPVDGNSIESETEYPILEKMIADVATLEATIEATEAQRAAAEAERADAAAGYVAVSKQCAEEVAVSAEQVKADADRAASEADRAKYEADRAKDISGGNFATEADVLRYSGIAESNANKYTDNAIADIATPDVSGQINTHNEDTSAHGDIREMVGIHNANQNAHKDIRNLIANKKGASVYTATLGTNWTVDANGCKTQFVALSGVTASNTALVDHAYTGDKTEASYATFVEAENQYLAYVTNGYAETENGGIRFVLFGDAPTVEIPIVVEVV